MEIAERLLDTVKLLNHFLVPRYITGELIRFAEREDIAKCLFEQKSFSLDEIISILKAKRGYKLNEPIRQKMVSNIINLFLECGFLDRNKDIYSWVDEMPKSIAEEISLTGEEKAILNDYFESQSAFLKGCMDYAAIFLKGGPHLYNFNGNSLAIWDSFLGNIEFSFARKLLLLNLGIKNTSDFKFLDIGYGPGYGIISAHELYPEIDITAIDFSGTFSSLVKEKLNINSETIKLISNGLWNGFGYPLPFTDDSFDAIFFTCADPYIPPYLRESVYREIYRIIKRGGALGILTRAYPDPEFRYVKNKWTRRATYCHDFAESVCEGWYGFYEVEESFRLFKKIGFSKNKGSADEISMLDSAIWILDKD